MIHQRYKSQSLNGTNIDTNDNCNDNDNDIHNDHRNDVHSDNRNDNDNETEKDKEEVHVNDAKVGALLYFPLLAIVITSCLGDMHYRNTTMHREPVAAPSLLVDCPVQDPDHVWQLLVFCYLVIIVSIGFLCHSMLAAGVGTPRPTRTRATVATTCRICLLVFYIAFYNWDICIGTMPYLKKTTTHVYYTCIILFISAPTLSMPVVIRTSKSSPSQQKPPRWPLFLIKMMVFITYADAGWHKLYFDFSGETLRSFLIHHWVIFEPPMALLLVDHPLLTSAASFATLIFECAGWILLCFDYDRVAALVSIKFHVGIWLAMNVDFITFWCCSFVFYFVPSIISSTAFQRLLKRHGGEKLASVPLPLNRSLRFGIEGENKDKDEDIPSTVGDSGMVTNGGSDSKTRQRKRKSSVLMAVSWALFFTYTGFYPYVMLLPDIPHSPNPSVLSILYENVKGMIYKPFNSYTMYSHGGFPMGANAAFLVLKQRRTSELTATKHDPVAPYFRVKWIPDQGSDFYFYSNILSKLGKHNKDDTLTLKSSVSASERTVTMCNIHTCLAKHYILGESAGVRTNDGTGGIRRKVPVVDGTWDVDSIELVREWYSYPTFLNGAVERTNPDNTKDNTKDDDDDRKLINSYNSFETTGTRTLRKHMVPYCALDLGGDRPQQPPRDYSRDFDAYDDGSCEDILADLDATARSFDGASGQKNPFHLVTAESRTQKYKYEDEGEAVQVGMGMVIMVMIAVGYKTYLLAR